MKLDRDIPRSVVSRAIYATAQLARGARLHELGGRRLRRDRSIAVLDLGHRYRMILKEHVDGTLEPTRVVSHETYNRIARGYTK